tara:strand:- start:1180 stop:2694 length:1515 start_codon:yes stop_codon:yes gene_type:complete
MPRGRELFLLAVLVGLACDPVCADDAARLETATGLSLPYSESGFINEEIRREILAALTLIQEHYPEVRTAYRENWYDLRTLLLTLTPEQREALQTSSTVLSTADGDALLAATGIDELDRLNARFKATSVVLSKYGWLDLTFAEPLAMLEVAKQYERIAGVEFAVTHKKDRPAGTLITLKEKNANWEFKFSASCVKNSTDCVHGSYKHHYFTYDRQSGQVRKDREEGILAILECSASDIAVIEKYAISELVSCHTRTYANDSETVDLVHIEHGRGHDCPSGCFYDTTAAFVDRQGIHPDVPKRGVTRIEIADRFAPVCGNVVPSETVLSRAAGKYRWADIYEDARARDSYGTECVINGYTVSGGDDRRIEIDVAYPTVSNCSEATIEQAWTDSCATNSPATCEYERRIGSRFSQDDCFERTAAIKNTPALCARIANRTHKSRCYFKLAMTGLEEDRCALIATDENDRMRTRCTEQVRKYRAAQSRASAPDLGEVFRHEARRGSIE